MNAASETIPFREHVPGTQPANNSPEYGSTHKRHPKQAPLRIPQGLTEIAGPRFSEARYPSIADLSRNGAHGRTDKFTDQVHCGSNCRFIAVKSSLARLMVITTLSGRLA